MKTAVMTEEKLAREDEIDNVKETVKKFMQKNLRVMRMKGSF